jgi:predicted RNase H-like HicB family nuclease
VRIAIIIRKSRTGYSADAPHVPGCIATARTITATRRLMTKALELHLELMAESGDRMPRAHRQFSFAAVHGEDEAFCTWVEVKEPQLA